MLKIYYTHQKKKTNFHPKKMSDAHACAKGIIFSNETIFYTHLKKPIFRLKKILILTWKKKSDEIISHSSLKKPKFHQKTISYTTTENPTFQPKNIIILSRKNPISEGQNILYLSEKNSEFLILTLPRPYPPLPVKKRFLKQKKSKILQLRCVLNTALLFF